MSIWWFYLISACIVIAGLGFIWLVIKLDKGPRSNKPRTLEDLDEATEKDIIEHIFTPEFREELKNRGRLHFEKIINESADFLQQDLRLTSSQLNEFMKNEINTKVSDELIKYEQSINDARDLAINTIKNTSLALEEQRKVLGEQVQQQIEAERVRIIDNFEKQLTDIISHYLVAAIGNQVDLNDQLEYILGDLEANKKAMIEDMKNA